MNRPGRRQVAGISTREYARHCGVSVSAIYQREKSKLVKRYSDRSIDVVASDKLFSERADPRNTPEMPVNNLLDQVLAEPPRLRAVQPSLEAKPEAAPSQTASLNAQRARKTKADAELSELKLAKAKATLVDVRDAGRIWFALVRRWRNRMRSIPNRLSARLAATTDQGEIRDMIAAEIDDALLILPDEMPDGE